ncbi:type IV pilus modification protein PilV [Acidovorax sp. SUPP1855]|uniref:type IV pilus modification protein PilV n=1 Tax=Acidovorax sp. SUPP1855 TaxID=431774 RepID=UPI0023DE3945|nr:type IV pilus modification protein PilV [Acidovorax sp. SUPP1855]GKS82670.1 type IV pilus modification protein PilV [Acidovorax sp. SUPP1855]
MTFPALLPTPRLAAKTPFRPRPIRQSLGFTLVEVLVAIMVLSFGMLGLVGMQAFALQSNREARLQAQAAMLARELAEMMRGNKEVGVKTATADNPYLVSLSSGSMVPATPSYCLSVGNAATGCSSATDIANAEMTDWLARVDNTLPGARVVICFDSAPYDSNGIPRWTCPTAGTNANEIAVIKIGWTRNSTDRSKTGSDLLEQASSSTSVPYIIFPVTSGNASSI